MVAMIDDDSDDRAGDRGILLEATERFKACADWQKTEDERTREDIKFSNADSRNMWQWPNNVLQNRGGDSADALPSLTINVTRVHNDLIINQLAKNQYGIKIRPTGRIASYKAAKMMESLVRRTEYISKASAQYRKVSEQAVDGGIGYIIIETAFVSERSFDQDIFLKASRDPTAVYLDPWITEPDGSDANFGFAFERLPRKEFNRKYPEWKNKVGTAPLDSAFEMWISDKEVMLAKYYRKEAQADILVAFKDQDGEWVEKLASEIREESGSEIYRALLTDIEDGAIDGKTRPVTNNKVKWYLIAGDQIIDRGDWAGKYIPICRQVGRELIIDGKLDRKGHTRSMIDAQRMLNYHASVSVETAAMAPKAQWIGPARAFEGQEQWKDANTKRYAYLAYNDIDDEAPVELQKVESPKRVDPPQVSPAYVQALEMAEKQIMMVSGQMESQLGQSERVQSAASGTAINERKQQGDLANYHFADHQSDMLRFVGVQLLDLYPKIYDTERTLHVIGDDGEKFWIKINPNQQDALIELQQEKDDEEAVKLAFNPAMGEYECVSDPGPDYATQRQDAWNAISTIIQFNKELVGVCGDLLFNYGDFPGADALRERLMREIKATKPYLFDDKAEPAMLAAQQQLQRLATLNTELMQKLSLKEISLKGKDEKRDIEAFRAQTDRLHLQLEALTRLVLTPSQREQWQHEIDKSSHDAAMQIILQSNAAEIQGQSESQNEGAST